MQQSFFGSFVSWVSEHGVLVGAMAVLVVVLAGTIIFMSGKRGK